MSRQASSGLNSLLSSPSSSTVSEQDENLKELEEQLEGRKDDSHKILVSRLASRGESETQVLQSTSSLSTAFSTSTASSVHLPAAISPLAEWLFRQESLTEDQRISVLFVVRLGDDLHRVGYATFLTFSFVQELAKKLEIPRLDVEVDVHALRWNYGGNVFVQRISTDYDGDAMEELSRIALGVLSNDVTPLEGLKRIGLCDKKKSVSTRLTFYRHFPGRILVVAITACSFGVTFFDATAVDSALGFLTGLVSGFILYVATFKQPLQKIEELLASISTSMILAGALALFPEKTCFIGQLLGSLFYFLYGGSFVIALYEMTDKLVSVGLMRFASALLNTLTLGMGAVVGLWIAAYAGSDRFVNARDQDCSILENQLSDYWLFLFVPILSIGVLMQLRISPQHWPACLAVQFVGFSSQYVLSTVWKQPVIANNLVPVWVSTVAAHVSVTLASRIRTNDVPNILRSFHGSTHGEDQGPRSLMFRAYARRSVLRFDDTGWNNGGGGMEGGYIRNQKFKSQRSGLWYCLIPTLFLVVPGASIWRIAFNSVLEATWRSDYARATQNVGELIAALLTVGISQVIGIRLGLVTVSFIPRGLLPKACGYCTKG